MKNVIMDSYFLVFTVFTCFVPKPYKYILLHMIQEYIVYRIYDILFQYHISILYMTVFYNIK